MKKFIQCFILIVVQISFAQENEAFLTNGSTENDLQSALGNPLIGTITFKTNISVTKAIVFPSDKVLKFFKGNKLIIEESGDLFFEGTFIDAGKFQIIKGNNFSGKLRNDITYPEWFGSNINDDEDDSHAIQKAINLTNNTVSMTYGEYILKKALDVENCNIALNKAILTFQFEGRDECLRMKNNSSVENGTIEYSGGQSSSYAGNYQCPIVVGNYPKGGGYHNVMLKNLTVVTNRKSGNGIFITGDSNEITIQNIFFPDSEFLGRGILIHWGGSDSVSTDNPKTYHPHNITIDNIKFGVMTLDKDVSNENKIKDAAGIFISGAYNVKVSNVQIEETHWHDGMINVFAGDYGNLYVAESDIMNFINKGIYFENCSIKRAYGRVVKIDCMPSKVEGGDLLTGPTLVNVMGKASEGNEKEGIIVANNTNTVINNCKMDGFTYGINTGKNVSGLIIDNGLYINSSAHGIKIDNSIPPADCVIQNVKIYHNGKKGDRFSGIYIGNSENSRILNNVIGKEGETQLWGIRINENARGTIIEGNSVKYSRHSAYSIGNQHSYGVVFRFKGNMASGQAGLFQTGMSPMIIDTRIVPNTNQLVREFIGGSKPSTGVWNKGDRIYNDLTDSTSFNGYLCIKSGTGTNAQWVVF